MPDLIRMSDTRDWSLDAAVAVATIEDVAGAIESTGASLRPLDEIEAVRRNAEGIWEGQCKATRDWLKPFGMVIAPNLTADARTNWLNALLVSLSDLPPDIVQAAAREAMHKPMTFLNEVHGQVREIADRMMALRRLSLARLHDLLAELRRAGDRARQLPAPADELTADDIRRMSPEMRKIGLGCGALTQEQIDAADGIEPSARAKAA